MQWKLVQLFGLLFAVGLAVAELDIPEDILDEELEDDEAILREIEEKHVVSTKRMEFHELF